MGNMGVAGATTSRSSWTSKFFTVLSWTIEQQINFVLTSYKQVAKFWPTLLNSYMIVLVSLISRSFDPDLK